MVSLERRTKRGSDKGGCGGVRLIAGRRVKESVRVAVN